MLLALTVLCRAAETNDLQREPRMTLSERVAASTLIVVGRFGPPGNTGKRTTTSVQVEQTLFGSVPTNTTLFVSYTCSLWMIPGVFSYPDPLPKHGSRWIFFLTDVDVNQPPGTNYYTRAIGPHRYSHDAFELAQDPVLEQVRELIQQKRK